MEMISVLLLVVSGAALSSGFGRIVFGWGYDVVVVATSVVIFGAGGLALIVFPKLGSTGMILALVVAILLTFIFVKFNVKDVATDSKNGGVLGCVYWITLLVIFTVSGLKSWDISIYINQIYSLDGNTADTFFFTLCLFILVGGLSMFMFIREYKQAFSR